MEKHIPVPNHQIQTVKKRIPGFDGIIMLPGSLIKPERTINPS
jgi:hypothetical protein